MKHAALTATGLRLALSISLFLIALFASIALYFFHDKLADYATHVSHVFADANASQSNVQTLQKVQKELKEDQEVIDRASSIVADSQSYQYQDQIINDLNGYASRAGISISNIDFSGEGASESTTTPATPKASPVPSGVKSTSVSIAIKNPVVYDNLMHFIKSIEQNLTKMQISNIGLAKGTGNDVTSEDLTIEVYIK